MTTLYILSFSTTVISGLVGNGVPSSFPCWHWDVFSDISPTPSPFNSPSITFLVIVQGGKSTAYTFLSLCFKTIYQLSPQSILTPAITPPIILLCPTTPATPLPSQTGTLGGIQISPFLNSWPLLYYFNPEYPTLTRHTKILFTFKTTPILPNTFHDPSVWMEFSFLYISSTYVYRKHLK